MSQKLTVGRIVHAVYTDESTALRRRLYTNKPYAAIVTDVGESYALLHVFNFDRDLNIHVAADPDTRDALSFWIWRWPPREEPKP